MKLFQQAISDLNELQYVLSLWQKANFEEDECTAEWMIVGATEELGEASHVLLKSRQKIREYPFGFDEKAKADLEDAVGDICVYLMSLGKFSKETGLRIEKMENHDDRTRN